MARHYIHGHVAAIRILTNCYGITNLLLQKFTFTENQTFLRNFYTTKIWSHMVVASVNPLLSVLMVLAAGDDTLDSSK